MNEFNRVKVTNEYKFDPKTMTSKMISTKEIVQLLQDPKKQKQALEQEIKKMEKEIGKSFTDEQKELVKEFIKASQKATKNQTDEVARDEVEELEDKLEKKLKETDFSRKDIKKVTDHCERLVELVEKQLEKLQLQSQIEVPTN